MDANFLPVNSILIQGVTPNDLESLISRLLDKKLASLSIATSNTAIKTKATGLLKRYEAAAKLRVSVVTLDNWTRAGIINARRIGTKKYYTEQDINEAMKRVNG